MGPGPFIEVQAAAPEVPGNPSASRGARGGHPAETVESERRPILTVEGRWNGPQTGLGGGADGSKAYGTARNLLCGPPAESRYSRWARGTRLGLAYPLQVHK